ncbi:Beta-1,4-galactosyltransferase 7 [Bulinus truncatus]|nr:Beta-1,4-galactosyltransferase 7 [Bulinus truncatus]
MARVLRKKQLFLLFKLGILITFLIAFVWGILIVLEKDGLSTCNCSNDGISRFKEKTQKESGGHKMCIIVPFRDRFEELLEFTPYMRTFLEKQNVNHKLIVVNQMDKYRFNRASLINVGFLESRNQCDYIAMHDVDLLPVNEDLLYKYPEESKPYHLAAPHLHPLYHYNNYAGGILLIRSTDFEKLNGLSNKYWGWGREDDEFFVRMRKANFTLQRPDNLTSGYQSFKHLHDRKKRPRDYNRYFDQKEKTRRLDRETGISTVKYEVDSIHEITMDSAPVTVINIFLECNVDFTPWCLQLEDHEAYLKQLEEKKLTSTKS